MIERKIPAGSTGIDGAERREGGLAGTVTVEYNRPWYGLVGESNLLSVPANIYTSERDDDKNKHGFEHLASVLNALCLC